MKYFRKIRVTTLLLIALAGIAIYRAAFAIPAPFIDEALKTAP